jgi:hypothetical protein
MTVKTRVHEPSITESSVPKFWGPQAPKREVRVVRLPHSTGSLPPLRSFLPDRVTCGGITCRQLPDPGSGKVNWQLHHLLRGEDKWTSGEVGNGLSHHAPTPIAIRPGSALGAMRLLSRHSQWMHMALFDRWGEREGTITFRNIVGAGFSGDGKLLVLASADGMIYMGKVNEHILEATYEDFGDYLQRCQTFNLRLGHGGELYSCEFALDFIGENVFLIGNCKATTLQDAGKPYEKLVLVDKRVRVWLRGSPFNQHLSLRSCAIEPTENWALNVRCFDPTNPDPAEDQELSRKKPTGAGRGAPPPKRQPGALGEGVSAIFTGMSPTHVQMTGYASTGRLIVPDSKAPAEAGDAKDGPPKVLNGAIVLDPDTMVDWHSRGVRVLQLSSAADDKLSGRPIVTWKPDAGRIIALQEVDRILYIYITPDVC